MRNTKLQVFVQPAEYLELVQFAKEHDLNRKTDSQMITSVLKYLLEAFDKYSIQTWNMQQQINKMKEELKKKDAVIMAKKRR